MQRVFKFENGTSTGILRNMFESPDYWDLFNFNATSQESETFSAKNIFDFSTNKYWIGYPISTPNNLTFCFKKFSILVEGYHLKTSSQTAPTSARAKIWGFSGSNNNITWHNYEEINHSLKPSETYYVPWTYNVPFRCFKLTTISGHGVFRNRFDLTSVDVFGYIVLDKTSYEYTHKLLPFSLHYFISQTLPLHIWFSK